MDKRAFGEQLRIFLERIDVGYSGLARWLKVSAATVTQWVQGKTRPDRKHLAMLVLKLYVARGPDSLEGKEGGGAFRNPEEVADWVRLLGYEVEDLAAGVVETFDEGDRARETFLAWLHSQAKPQVDVRAQGVQLPSWYVERSAELEHLKALLRAEKGYRTPAVKRVVLWGMGGVGKTVLARAVAVDEEVERYFRSGVLWAELGPEGEPRRWLERWCKQLQLPLRGDETEWELQRRVGEFLSAAEHRFLLVIDDVWRAEDLEPLLVEGPQSRVLITARELHPLQKLGVDDCVIEVGVMREEEALELVRLRLGARWQEGESSWARELVRLVDGLPLALQLAAAVVKRRGWEYVMEQVGRERRRFRTLRLGALGERVKRRALVRLLLRLHSEPLPGDLQQYIAGWEVCAGPRLEAQTRLPSRDLYVTRPELEGQIERHLLAGQEGEHHVLVYGLRGMGATTVAKMAAMEIEGLGPISEGVLWADLGLEGVGARDWLREWAVQLGLGGDGSSVDENAVRAAAYLSRPERRVLIVLDDVQDVGQAGPLLIGGPHCRYLLTSSSAGIGREVERPLRDCVVGPMSMAEGVELVERIVGKEGLAWSREVVEVLGGYPLALSLVARVAKARGEGYVLARLRGRDDYFDTLLAAEELAVGRILHEVYRSLSAEGAVCLQQLAVSARGAELTVEQVAGMLGWEVQVVEDLLWQLREVGLVEEEVRGDERYWRLLPLVADWVRRQVGEAGLVEARARQVGYYGRALLQVEQQRAARFADFRLFLNPRWFEAGEGRFYWERDGLNWLANIRVGWEWAAHLGEGGQVWRVLYYLGALGGALDRETVWQWQDQALAAAQQVGPVTEVARLSLLPVLYWLQWEGRNPNLVVHRQGAWFQAQQMWASAERADDVLYSSLRLTVDRSLEQCREVEGALWARSEWDAEAARLLYLLGWWYKGEGEEERAQQCFKEASWRFRRQGQWGGMVLAVLSYSGGGQAGWAEVERVVEREREWRLRGHENARVRELDDLLQAVVRGDFERVVVSERVALAMVFEGEWQRQVEFWWQQLEKSGNKGR